MRHAHLKPCSLMALAACAGLALLAALGALPGAASAADGHKHSKRLILTPRAGEKVPARPVTVRVRAGRAGRMRAKLNGRALGGRHFRPGAVRRVRRAQLSPSHGLKHGRNVLRVWVRRNRTRPTRVQTVRFRVARDRPLAAAGADRRAVTGAPVPLSGLESRVHPSARTVGEPPHAGLDYRWRVKRAPRGSKLRRRPLPGAGSHSPTFAPTRPGRHVLRLRVRAPDGQIGRDTVRFDVAAPPMVEVDTQVPTQNGAISVGGQPYPAQPGAWLQIVVLNRATLEAVSNQSFSCSGARQPCIDRVKQAFSGNSKLDDTALVLAANHPESGQAPAGAPDALKAIGVGVSDRGWPWYVDPRAASSSGGYSAVGVPGNPPGTAAEAFARISDSSKPCDRNCAAVRGYLVQDYGDVLNYNWMSAERVPFDTRAKDSSDTQNVIQIGGRTYTQQLGGGQSGGFQVVVADRYDLSKVETHWFPTAGSSVNEQSYQGALDAMAATLRGAASTPIVNALPGNNGKPLCLALRAFEVIPNVTLAWSDTCNGTDAQQVVAVPGISPGDGTAGVELRAKGRCIEAAGSSDPPLVGLAPCDGQQWQQWHFDDQGRIVSSGGKCLAISGDAADHDKPGQPLWVVGCQPWQSQKWRTDSSKIAFVAPVGSPQVRLTVGSPSERTTYDRGVKITTVGDAVAALGGTAHAFNSLPATTSTYGLVGWAGAVPARAPEESGHVSDQLPTARIAGTLSTDKWQRYEVQDTEPGATRSEPNQPSGPGASLAARADDTQPMDVVWGAPTTLWPDQDPETGSAGKRAAVACISIHPTIHRGGDVRAAYFKDKWSPSQANGWGDTRTAIAALTYQSPDPACPQLTFSEADFKWAQEQLKGEITNLLTVHEYLEQLLLAQGSAGAVFSFENKVDTIAQQLRDDKVVPPPTPQDKTAVWTRLIVNTAIDLIGAIPAVGPFAKEGFEIAKSIVEAGGAIMNGVLDGIEVAKDTETQEPGPPSDELAGPVNAVNKQIIDQYTAAQNGTDLFARIVASDPAKLATIGTLRDGCRDNDACPAAWRLTAHDQAVMGSALSYSTERTVWSMLVPAAYTAWSMRIRAYGPGPLDGGDTRPRNFWTTITGFKDASKFRCFFNPGIGAEQYIHPFASAGPNGMAAFRQGYGYEGSGTWERDSDSLNDGEGSNGLLWKLWVLGIKPGGDNENYTVPGGNAFDRLFRPVDPTFNPQKGGLGVDKESWYAQTFIARQYSPKDSKWYTREGFTNCDYE